ncbi:hypothetical protein H114_11286 [Streptomyces gancidicus BKS 13-15]|uniref:Uncharacterized protein n=1 Tax=Streptomyces gancidicus BKS 13-15 TaxID=1284664 RepID=M3DG07_STREZ|nr:hypothetical protein H114_11286 [Streptomyces gancidicus BKS 13-15]
MVFFLSAESEGRLATAKTTRTATAVRAPAATSHFHGRGRGLVPCGDFVVRRTNASAKREEAPSRSEGSCGLGWGGTQSPVNSETTERSWNEDEPTVAA